MGEWEELTQFSWTYWVAGFFALAEFFKWLFTFKDWFFKSLGIETRTMREKRELEERLKKAEKDIEEIKNTAKKNVDMFLEHEKAVVEQIESIRNDIVNELNRLHKKIDEQQEQLEQIDREGKKRDCAVLRDRILSGMRYFSQNKDEHGNVHISIGDFENMKAMFDEYFSAGGNGFIKDKVYEEEFLHFIIDR